jgi:hypothetical protein
MLVLVAGPYRSGTGDDPAKLAANVAAMNEAALAVYRAGHLPVTGEALALPLIELAGSWRVGDAAFNEVFHPIAQRLLARCDAVLRVGGPSAGADEMVAIGREHGKARRRHARPARDGRRRLAGDRGLPPRHGRHLLPRRLERAPDRGPEQRLLRGGRAPARPARARGRVVGLASRDKLGTTAQFGIGPATALTHLATEPDLPSELLDPYVELGIRVVPAPKRAPR